MRHVPDTNALRIAHIFELETSRHVADAFSSEFDGVQLVESSMDSARQLDALLSEQLDVAVMRVTPQMLADRPLGWQRRLIRLEPLLLVGRPGEPPRESVSLHERPVEVFADATGSAMFNVHGEYLAAFERQTRVALRWLGNPGTFGHCLAAVKRAQESAFTLEYECYAQSVRRSRHPRAPTLGAAAGLPVVGRLARGHDVGVDPGLRQDCPGDLGAARLAPAQRRRTGADLATVRRPCGAGAVAGLTRSAPGRSGRGSSP